MRSVDVIILVCCTVILMATVYEVCNTADKPIVRALWWVLIPSYVISLQSQILSIMTPHLSFLSVMRNVAVILFLYCAAVAQISLYLTKRSRRKLNTTAKETV